MAGTAIDLQAEVAAALPRLIALRRDLHQHPELAFQERRTARVIAERLRAAGLEVREGVAATGVVALLEGGRPGPTVAVRADMDALPLEEEGDRPYRSRTPGVMHACGHDGHVAVAVTLAEIFARHRAALPGRVKFIFQPAEETAGGAERMIAEGVLEAPHVDRVLGLHLWNYVPVGQVAVKEGPIFASVDELRITVRGRGGHGAIPHDAIDPVVVAAHLVTALQALVSREISPHEPVVLTIGAIHGGTAFNIIPERCELLGTLRTFDPQVRRYLLERVEGLARGLTAAFRAEATVHTRASCPAVVNDRELTELVRRAAAAELGEAAVVDTRGTLGGDDMADYLALRPGCYFFVGARNEARGLDRSHHNPGFDFDEAALEVAARVLGRATLAALTEA
ncbi:MAG TPA: amidohydrolase [Chloroflexota bacterium]|nr:amidohydrolase [Chloroflexota bacterium]